MNLLRRIPRPLLVGVIVVPVGLLFFVRLQADQDSPVAEWFVRGMGFVAVAAVVLLQVARGLWLPIRPLRQAG